MTSKPSERLAARPRPNLMQPLSRRASLLLAFVALAFTLFWFAGRTQGDFRIDEAHKLSETRALRLLLDGRFDDPEWFATIVDRTNPPFGKYFFGLAVLIGGEQLPAVPSLARHSDPGDYIPPQFSRELSEPYRPLLTDARRGALVITAITAAVLIFLIARSSGVLAALVALALYLSNFLTATFAATIVFDPLLTLLTVSAIASALMLWSDERSSRLRVVVSGGAVGLFAALAVSTRFSGAIVLPIALAYGISRPLLRREWRTILLFALIVVAIFAIVPIAINPYYWASPPAASVDPEFMANAPLPVRIADRLSLQYRDLADLLARTEQRTATLHGYGERSRFFFEIVAGDVQGLLVVLGAFLSIVLVAAGVIPRSSLEAALVYASAVLTIVIVGWIPVAWPRYLLITVPLLSAAAGIGFVALTRAWWSRRRSA